MIKVEKIRNFHSIYYVIKGTKILHRDDGPAIIYDNGRISWFLHNNKYATKETWFKALTEEQQAKALYSEYFIGG
jgi:hypothetical protein